MVLDIGMPSFNGCEVPQRVRSQTKGDFPLLVVVTGWGQDDDRCKALHAVLDLHLTKPFDPRELIHVIAKRAMALGSS